MILSRQHFDLGGKTVLERIRIRMPFHYQAIFQNEACFLHFRTGNAAMQSPTEQLSVQARDSILLKCGTYFVDWAQQQTANEAEVIAIHLYPELLREIYQQEIPPFIHAQQRPYYTLRIENEDLIGTYMQGWNLYFEHPNLVTDELMRIKLKELILLLLHTQSAESLLDLFAHLFSPRQANMAEVVQAHLYQDLPLERLATLSGMSLSTFKREFFQHFNESPGQYFRTRRLQKAQSLLQHTSLAISEIAFQIGFKDAAHFTRAFRQQFGLTPSQFRQQGFDSAV